MIDIINDSWGWQGIKAIKILDSNDFGNIIFQDENDEYYRICPEEIYCKKIAQTAVEYENMKSSPSFIEDWQMGVICKAAESILGKLKENEKYCLKLPSVLGGLYENDNFGKIPHDKLISYSGAIGFEIKDLPNGQVIRINTEEQ